MLTIIIPEAEMYNQEKNEFFKIKKQELVLEHSLISLAKWESKWHIPFMQKEPQKTNEQLIDYIRCMTITQNVDPNVYFNLTSDNIKDVSDYIEEPMTATWFKKSNGTKNRSIVTAELIYYWMIALNIPFECQKWHLNRLLTLINVCNEENRPKEKMNKKALLSRNKNLNSIRRTAMKSKG